MWFFRRHPFHRFSAFFEMNEWREVCLRNLSAGLFSGAGRWPRHLPLVD
jgi:hypothetical protein